MNRSIAAGVIIGFVSFAFVSCERSSPAPAPPTTTAVRPQEPPPASPAPVPKRSARDVAEEFGRRMKNVSTLSPPDVAAAEIRSNYGDLVEPALLKQWIDSPGAAPGRQVSSPWPDRLVITDEVKRSPNETVVRGVVVEKASTGESGRVAATMTLRLSDDDRWRIASFTGSRSRQKGAAVSSSPQATDDRAAAIGVLKDYYAAIDARDFDRAFAAWGESGPPGQTREEFEKGFAETASVSLDAGAPSSIGAAAGSRYVDVPVVVNATLKSGSHERFTGTYTLRRSVVDGATAAQRKWHIYKASLRRSGT